MFEREKNSSSKEPRSLLSLDTGADSAVQDISAAPASSQHLGSAQNRHRIARAKREGRGGAAFDAPRTQTTRATSDRLDPALPGEAPDLNREEEARPSEIVTGALPRERPSEVARESAASTSPMGPSDDTHIADVGAETSDLVEPQVSSRQYDHRASDDQVWTPLIDPLKVIGRVADSKLLIVSMTVLGAAIGVGIALSTPKKYEAYTELLVDPRDLKLSDRDLTQQGLPSDATLAIVENQTRVLTSGTVLTKVVEDLNLTSDPEFNGEQKTFGLSALIGELRGIMSRRDSAPQSPDYRQTVALENLARALTVERSGKTFIITVGAKTESAEKSALIANTMASVFLQTYGQIQSQTAGRATDELTARLDELRKGVETAERKVAAFKAENDIVDPQGRLITDDEIIKLNDQLSIARARTLELNARAASVRGLDINAVLSGAIPESIGSNIITELRSQYAALNSEAERLSVRLGPRHPELQAVEAQLAGARTQIANELRRITSSMQVELRRAVELEQDLAQRLAQLKVRQGDLSEGLVQLRELEREASTKRAVYESYLLRSRETGEQRDINTANMSVISTAYAPLDPTGPSRSMIALTGAFLGFASGVGLAMLRGAYESLRDRRRVGQRRQTPPDPPTFPDGGSTPRSGKPSRSRNSTAPDQERQASAGASSRSGAAASNRAKGQIGAMTASYVLAERATERLGYSNMPRPGAFAHPLRGDVAQASYTVGDHSAEINLRHDDLIAPKPMPHSRRTTDNDEWTSPQAQGETISSQSIEDIRASIADFRAAVREFAGNRQTRRYI